MNNKNCESLHNEYKELKKKERLVMKAKNEKNKAYNSGFNWKDTSRMIELAKELVNNCNDYVKNLSAHERAVLRDDADVLD